MQRAVIGDVKFKREFLNEFTEIEHLTEKWYVPEYLKNLDKYLKNIYNLKNFKKDL